MKLLSYSLLLAAAFAAASARCPNLCSGHGDCNNDDRCICWSGYQGFDCSQRTCPMVEAWALDESSNPHDYAECGNRGICDRSTGVCQCFDGFTGRGCERVVCPNDCSGRGKCHVLADLPAYMPQGSALSWDEKAMTACVCDPGFMGPDCSQRICPHGDDPMTACDTTQMKEVQNFEVWIPGNSNTDADNANMAHVWLENDYTGVTFTTDFNESFSVAMNNIFALPDGSPYQASSTIGADLTSTSTGIQSALRAVPRQRLQDVDVTAGLSNVVDSSGNYDLRSRFMVTFAQSGKQKPLQCSSVVTSPMADGSNFVTYGCPFEGCQPRILQPRAFTQAYGCVRNTQTTEDFIQASATGSASAIKVSFTDDSLLVCPTGKTCNTDGSNNYQAGIEMLVYQIAQNGDYYIYAQGLGSQKYQAGLSYAAGAVVAEKVPFQSIQDETSSDSTRFFGGTDIHQVPVDVSRDSTNYDYKFLGIFKTLTGEIDVSRIIPGTKVTLSGVANEIDNNCGGATDYPKGLLVRTHYSVAQCGGVSTNLNPSPDAENIECSRRGQCNRDTGLCECFDGYYGSACEQQTILV